MFWGSGIGSGQSHCGDIDAPQEVKKTVDEVSDAVGFRILTQHPDSSIHSNP